MDGRASDPMISLVVVVPCSVLLDQFSAWSFFSTASSVWSDWQKKKKKEIDALCTGQLPQYIHNPEVIRLIPNMKTYSQKIVSADCQWDGQILTTGKGVLLSRITKPKPHRNPRRTAHNGHRTRHNPPAGPVSHKTSSHRPNRQPSRKGTAAPIRNKRVVVGDELQPDETRAC